MRRWVPGLVAAALVVAGCGSAPATPSSRESAVMFTTTAPTDLPTTTSARSSASATRGSAAPALNLAPVYQGTASGDGPDGDSFACTVYLQIAVTGSAVSGTWVMRCPSAGISVPFTGSVAGGAVTVVVNGTPLTLVSADGSLSADDASTDTFLAMGMTGIPAGVDVPLLLTPS
jgi:hypothetical protein